MSKLKMFRNFSEKIFKRLNFVIERPCAVYKMCFDFKKCNFQIGDSSVLNVPKNSTSIEIYIQM